MKKNCFLIALLAGVTFTFSVCATEYKTDAVEIKESVFYEKQSGQPLTGTLIRTYPDGAKFAASVFEKGILNGESKAFFPNGKVEHIVNFKNNKKDGSFKKYDENGNLIVEANYIADKLTGEFVAYYPNGKIYLKENYKDDKLNGQRISFYDNGQIKSEASYANDLLNGVAKEYYADGKVRSESHYKNNERDGVSKTYYPDGKPEFELNFVKNKLNGTGINYDKTGKLSQRRIYKDGLVVSGTLIENGKEVALSQKQIDELNSKNILHTQHNSEHKDGLVIDKQSKKPISGVYIVVNDKGMALEEYEFWNGQPHGRSVTYDKNGRISQITLFEEGKKTAYHLLTADGKISKTCKVENDKEICK